MSTADQTTGMETFNYNNDMMNDLWKDIAEGFYNYGRISPHIDPDTIPNLSQANEDMIDYIISKLKIGKDSHILDICSGRGMYTVGIAKRTGCRYTGTDINEMYMEESRKLAEKHGVSERGEFIYSPWAKMNEKVKEKKYTHVISLGSMYYGHNVLDTVFKDMGDCCHANTKVFIGDYVRKVDWEDCADANRHLKLGYPMASKEEVVEKIENSRLKLTDYEDFTQYVTPGYKVMTRECRKRDPEMKHLTYPLVGQAFMEGKMGYVIYHLGLRAM